MDKLLVIDDEPNIVFSISSCLGSSELEVISAGTARDGIDKVATELPDAVILDVRLPDQSGLDAYDKIREIDPRLPVIMLTAFARPETAIEAMQRGAFEYLLKPVDVVRLREVVRKAVEASRLNRIPAILSGPKLIEPHGDRIIGQSAAMQEVYKTIGRVAGLDATVLILGESGTGKELVARALYHYSKRSSMPFLAINCAALPESLLESELFGHERGAFTGADHRRIGKFEQVNGGTIFLDEIGDMTPATQAKALRLLQQQQFERVGGNETITTDVRVIAATNQDLQLLVSQGKFRSDLFYRLCGFTIHLPALRARRDDIPLLTDYFIDRENRDLRRSVASVAPAVRDALARHNWPGNIRELQSAVRYAVLHSTTDAMTLESLPKSCQAEELTYQSLNLRFGNEVVKRVAPLLEERASNIFDRVMAETESALLEEVIRYTRGRQVAAAELLGISRVTLRTKLRAHNINPDQFSSTRED